MLTFREKSELVRVLLPVRSAAERCSQILPPVSCPSARRARVQLDRLPGTGHRCWPRGQRALTGTSGKQRAATGRSNSSWCLSNPKRAMA